MKDQSDDLSHHERTLLPWSIMNRFIKRVETRQWRLSWILVLLGFVGRINGGVLFIYCFWFVVVFCFVLLLGLFGGFWGFFWGVLLGCCCSFVVFLFVCFVCWFFLLVFFVVFFGGGILLLFCLFWVLFVCCFVIAFVAAAATLCFVDVFVFVVVVSLLFISSNRAFAYGAMDRWIIFFMVDSLRYFSFQPVFHNFCNKGCDM